MALRHAIRRGSGVMNSTVARQMARAGGGPPMPIYSRTKPIDFVLHEEHDLIWDDGVAAETCLDFDVAHISRGQGMAMWLAGLGTVAFIYYLVSLTEPEKMRKAVPRTETMFPDRFKLDKLRLD